MEKISKYEIIKQDLISKIQSRTLKANQVISSEHELCEQYQVSRITVRKAIDELVHEGLLYRLKGKGCFVRQQAATKLSRIYSFTEAIVNEGKVPSKKQLLFQKQAAGSQMGEKLGIEADEDIYVIKSLYFADGIPYCVNTSYIPEKRFPKLDYFNFNDNSLYEILKNFYDLSFTKVKQVMNAIVCDKEIYEYLGVKEKSPVLKIDATSYGLHEDKEEIFEVYESFMLTDILHYAVEKHNI